MHDYFAVFEGHCFLCAIQARSLNECVYSFGGQNDCNLLLYLTVAYCYITFLVVMTNAQPLAFHHSYSFNVTLITNHQ